MAKAEVEQGRDGRQQEARGREGGNGEQKDGVGEEAVQVGDDQKQAGEDEGGEDGEESGVPELVWTEAYNRGGAQAEEERSHEAYRGQNTEGREKDAAEVEDIGMQGENDPGKARKPTRGAVQRSAGEPVLRRRDPAVVL